MAFISKVRNGGGDVRKSEETREQETREEATIRELRRAIPGRTREAALQADNPTRSTAESCGHSPSPIWGKRRVPDIRRSDIAALHHKLRDTRYQANRTLAVLSKMFNLAELWGLRPDGSNPCLHVKRYKEEQRERFLSAAEFQRLGRGARRDSRGRLRDPIGGVTAIRLLMLTGLPGARRSRRCGGSTST